MSRSAGAGASSQTSAAGAKVLLSALFEGRLISPESLAGMTANEEYGFGIGRQGGLFGHGGWIPGYSTIVIHAPHTGTTAFAVATNDTVDVAPTVAPVVDRLIDR